DSLANPNWREPFLRRSSIGEENYQITDSVPALRQILAPEDPKFRELMVRQLVSKRHFVATETLAQLAIFDTDVDVRNAATLALKDRPVEDYSQTILAGFRYPWLPVAQRAAAVAIAVQREELVPGLVRLLDQPDPLVPRVRQTPKGKVNEVSELVRINHHRN